MTEYNCEVTIERVTYWYQTMAAVTATQAYHQLDKWLYDEHKLPIEIATRLTFKRVAL